MGISVAEYFARKEACNHCVEHDDEEHCTTTLLSRSENCFFYNAVKMSIGEYNDKEREAARNLRNSIPEEVLVDYYFRGEKLIEKMNLMYMPSYQKYDVMNKINHLYIKNIIDKLMRKEEKETIELISNMLNALELENNIRGN
jgi:hypothetical protein